MSRNECQVATPLFFDSADTTPHFIFQSRQLIESNIVEHESTSSGLIPNNIVYTLRLI